MKFLVLAVLAAAGTAASAHATFGYSYEFSTDGGVTFTNTAVTDASSGPVDVQFRVVAYATPGTNVNAVNGPGPAIAAARTAGSERFNNFGVNVGDSVSNMTRGVMTAGNAAYVATSVNNGNTILGTTSPLSFATQLLLPSALVQYAPSSGGTPQYAWVVRTGTLHVGPTIGNRVITFQNNSRLLSTWYRDLLLNGAQDVNTAKPDGDPIDFNGTLTILPTPSTLALASFAAVCTARRRRATH